jgi:hypothetical protein
MTFGFGFYLVASWMAIMVAFLWVTNPKHQRTRRVLGPVLRGLVGVAIWSGLID